MAHLGDFALETTIYAKFCTVTTTGAPTVLAGTPVVSVYENDDNTQITAGVTLNVDEDGVVGLNQLVIAATAANGYEAGKFYDAVITTGTVGGTSVVGYCVASFTLQATSALRPTTAGRTLDVAAGGEADVNVTQIDGQATSGNNATLNLKQLNIVNSTGSALIASSTGNNGHGIAASGNGTGEGLKGTGGATGHGAEFIGGATSGDGLRVAGTGGDGIGLNAVGGATNGHGISATGAGDGSGLFAIGGAGTGAGIAAVSGTSDTAVGFYALSVAVNGDGIKATGTGTGKDIDGDITGSLSGSVGSVTGAVGSVGAGGITAASFAANAITAAKLDPDVTTELQAGLATAAAVDTIDDFLDTEVAAILAAVDTEVAAIKTQTDKLTFTVANVVDANVQRINDVAITGDGSGTPFNV